MEFRSVRKNAGYAGLTRFAGEVTPLYFFFYALQREADLMGR